MKRKLSVAGYRLSDQPKHATENRKLQLAFRLRLAGGYANLQLATCNLQFLMDHLWTPWRYAYITRSEEKSRTGVPPELRAWPAAEDRHCVFCNMIAAADYAIAHGMEPERAERAIHLVHRGKFCFICLNAYPYSTGHVLITPYQHVDSLSLLPIDAAYEMMQLTQQTEAVLQRVYRPNGINLGMNLGEAAGAGVAGHIHQHALPRWIGDTNFMTVTAETRVLPEALDVTWAKLRDAYADSATQPASRSSNTL